jgi:DNA-directed RNA polymerase subunit RPC12/RpoP
MKVEVCVNCGSEIGQLERAYIYEGQVVCQKCDDKLRGVFLEEKASEKYKKPGKLSAIAGMRMGAGICNIIAGIAFCWLCFPIVMIPFGIIEIITASNLLKDFPSRIKNPKLIPILEIVVIVTLAGWISVVVGILSLVFFADEKVKRYLACLPER